MSDSVAEDDGGLEETNQPTLYLLLYLGYGVGRRRFDDEGCFNTTPLEPAERDGREMKNHHILAEWACVPS